MSETKILVVGVNEAMAERLRSILQADGGLRWKVSFAPDAEQALIQLRRLRVSAVICGLRLPGMEGTAFLAKVRERYPAAARLILAEQPESNELIDALHVAQQVLHASADNEALRDAIQRICSLQQLIGKEKIRRIVGKLDQLPSVPRTYWALTRAASRPGTNMSDFANIIHTDAAMSVKVLQVANSAVFGIARRMTSIDQAVGFLGTEVLKGLILMTHGMAAFKAQDVAGFSLDHFQSYSMRVARVAKQMLPDPKRGDEAFTAGVMHDIGRLIIALRLPSEFAAVMRRVSETLEAVHLVERELVGASHAEIGAYFLGTWGLPLSIVQSVAYHHVPGMAPPGDWDLLAAVHAADVFLGAFTCGEPESRLDVAFIERAGFGGEVARWRAIALAEADNVAA